MLELWMEGAERDFGDHMRPSFVSALADEEAQWSLQRAQEAQNSLKRLLTPPPQQEKGDSEEEKY